MAVRRDIFDQPGKYFSDIPISGNCVFTRLYIVKIAFGHPRHVRIDFSDMFDRVAVENISVVIYPADSLRSELFNNITPAQFLFPPDIFNKAAGIKKADVDDNKLFDG